MWENVDKVQFEIVLSVELIVVLFICLKNKCVFCTSFCIIFYVLFFSFTLLKMATQWLMIEGKYDIHNFLLEKGRGAIILPFRQLSTRAEMM